MDLGTFLQLITVIDKVGPTIALAVVAFGFFHYHRLHKQEHSEILERLVRLEDNDESVAERLERNEKLILKLTIVDKNMPRSARLEAYDEYRLIGGNSWVENYVQQNLIDVPYNYGRRIEDK